MLPSVFPRLATDSAGRVFPGVWKPLFLKFPSRRGFPARDRAPSLPPLSPFSSFIFFPTCFWRQWSAFLVAWCPLPAYRSCFMEFAQRWNVLLRNLWGRKWSSRPIPPPSFSHVFILFQILFPFRLISPYFWLHDSFIFLQSKNAVISEHISKTCLSCIWSHKSSKPKVTNLIGWRVT